MDDELLAPAEPLQLAAKVAFLRSPEAYPGRPAQVMAIETHMSWVFVAGDYAYKLKKPIRRGTLDYGTLERRRANCAREVALNTRLAPHVYLGVVPLTLENEGSLRLDGPGLPVEWLVRMRRLDPEATLQQRILSGTASSDALAGAARRLAGFFHAAARVPLSPGAYRARFRAHIHDTRVELGRGAYGLPARMLDRLAAMLLAWLDRDEERLAARAARVIEGHGDLRPEHVYLTDPPLVTDCLEFDRDLRLLDPLDELAYLALECERLGAPEVGVRFIDIYRDANGDAFPDDVLHFYGACNAWRRSRLAIWHLDDGGGADVRKWRERALRYLELGCAHAVRCTGIPP